MSRTIAFRRVARREYDDAADWYEARDPGCGVRFIHEVDRFLERIRTDPDHFAVVRKNVREALVPVFPYVIYFVKERKRILVVAVIHAARDPAIWQSRI